MEFPTALWGELICFAGIRTTKHFSQASLAMDKGAVMTNAGKIPSRKRVTSQDRELRQAASLSRNSKGNSSRVHTEEKERPLEANKRK